MFGVEWVVVIKMCVYVFFKVILCNIGGLYMV